MNPEDDQKLMYIYEWVDSVPLSRSKKNIARDFCDAVLLAELIKSSIPQIVELHNYPSAHNSKQKEQNWNTLNRKVLKKLGMNLSSKEIEAIINCQPYAVEQVLSKVHSYLMGDKGRDVQ